MKVDKIPVELLIPCIIDQYSPQTGFNAMKILERVGCKIYYNQNQTCCGQPAYHAGYLDMAKEVGEKYISEHKSGRIGVILSGSCASTIKEDYAILFENTATHNSCKVFQKEIFEFSDFLINHLKIDSLGSALNARVTLLDGCKGMRTLHTNDAPRKLINMIDGIELIDMHNADVCCGFGGIFSVNHGDTSIIMARDKIDMAIDTGAEFLVCTDPGCQIHLETYIIRNNLPLRAIHIADIIAKGIK